MKNVTRNADRHDESKQAWRIRNKALFLSGIIALTGCPHSTPTPGPVQVEFTINPIPGGQDWMIENKTNESIDAYIDNIKSIITIIHNGGNYPIQNITSPKIIIEDAPTYADGKNYRIIDASNWAFRIALLKENNYNKLGKTFVNLFNTLVVNNLLSSLGKQLDNSKETVRLGMTGIRGARQA